MPFTYLSHQAPVLAVKMRWPTAFDGTALVVGSMAPDWAYALDGTWLAFDGHSLWGVALFCVPVAVLAAGVIRRVAPVVFAYLPSPAGVDLRQLRALAGRRPPWPMTAASALVGALTHVGWDLFTHPGRWGARHIAWLRSEAPTILGRRVTWSTVLQYAGHVLGAAVALYLLAHILRSGAFRRWYGLDGLDPDRPPPAVAGRVRFWGISALGAVVGFALAAVGEPGFAGRIIRVSLGLAAGLVAASVATGDTGDPAAPVGSPDGRWR